MYRRKLKALSFIIALVLLTYFLFHRFDKEILLLLEKLENSPILYSSLNIGLLSLDAILPIPSSILMFLNGKVLGITNGSMIGLIGVSLGNCIAYTIGYKSSKIIKNEVPHEISHKLLSNFGIWSIIITRALPVLAEAIMIYAGMQKYKFKPIMIYAVLGYIPVCLVYTILGSLMFKTNGFLLAFSASIIFSLMTMLFVYLSKNNFELNIYGRED